MIPGIVRKTGLLLTAAGIVTGLTVVVPGAASAATYYRLQNDTSAGCIQQSGSSADDANCGSSGSQYWALQAATQSGYYKLVNESSGACIDATNFDSAVAVDACAQGSSTQKWKQQDTSAAGFYKFVNLEFPSQCLMTSGRGTEIITYACAQGNGEQYWAPIS